MSDDVGDITAFYATMETSDSEPVGWVLNLPSKDILAKDSSLLPEVQEWMDMNIQDQYWVSAHTHIEWGYRPTQERDQCPVEFNFSTENDYILFKLRWG